MNKITIGMPVFNDIKFIEQSINSILSQSYINFTLIISDDGSSDGSAEVCLKYAKTDPRIKYIKQSKNLGISKNMEYLLAQASTKYFMWAADDDLWHPNFLSSLINLLEENPNKIVAFCPYYNIDEQDKRIELKDFDFSNINKTKRLLNFIKKPDDAFGYGVFFTEKIKQVKFPVWLWPNSKTAYNNIYPSLCFYLSKGNYVHFNEPLFFKRVKEENNINHKIAGSGNGIKELLFFTIRRINLVGFSLYSIFLAKKYLLIIISIPFFIHYWIIKTVYSEAVSAVKNKLKK